ADHEISGVGHAARHVEAYYEQAGLSHLEHRLFNCATHQRAGQNQGLHTGKAGHGAHRVGQRLLADEWNCVDGDVLAADVVAVGFGDGADGDLSNLRPAAHDDDALAIDFLQALDHFDILNVGKLAQVGGESGDFRRQINFKIN